MKAEHDTKGVTKSRPYDVSIFDVSSGTVVALCLWARDHDHIKRRVQDEIGGDTQILFQRAIVGGLVSPKEGSRGS